MSDDRTAEFMSLARGLPGGGAMGGGSSLLPPGSQKSGTASQSLSTEQKINSNPAYAELRAFHQTAGEISRDIASTSALLQELAQLVRHKSLFNDDSAHVNQLVVRVKTSIENLNSRLDQAGQTIQQQKRTLGKNSQAGQEASNLVDGLKTEFAQAAGSFKKVLQQRTDKMKETDEFQRNVYGGNDNYEDDNPIPNMSALGAPPVYSSTSASDGALGSFPTLDLTSGMLSAGELTNSNSELPRPHGIAATPASAPSGINLGTGASGMRYRRAPSSEVPSYYGVQQEQPLTPLDIQRMEEENGGSQQMQLIPDQNYLHERANAMSQVESNIVELGTVFNKLATMVSEHAEMVQRVEDNVDDANVNINMSLQTLTDTLTNLTSGRGLAIKLGTILTLFIIMFIVFFA